MAVFDEWNEDQLKEMYLERGYTLKNLSEFYGYSKSTISRALRKFNIKKGSGWRREVARPEYLEEDMPMHVVGNEELETNIRDALFRSVDRMNRKLSDMIPVGYDPDEDLWVVNAYTNPDRPGHDYPMEVHIRYDPYVGEYTVKTFSLRGKEDKGTKRALQRELNTGIVV